MTLQQEMKKGLLALQKGEVAGYEVYNKLAEIEKNPENRRILKAIASEEWAHSRLFQTYTQEEAKANPLYVWFMVLVSRIFGLTFGLKLLEKVEARTDEYWRWADAVPEMEDIVRDEEAHERKLIEMIDEEKLSYMSSVVLGLNDALVELTGALAGFTLSIQNSRTIALMGLITGISASFSMAASEYLSTKSENQKDVDPKRAAFYTGIAYVFTVFLLVLPFFLLSQYIVALLVTVLMAILIIALFNYYITVVKEVPFRGRFMEMAGISVGVALISFLIGFLVQRYFGLDI